jgi:hypothetical protein
MPFVDLRLSVCGRVCSCGRASKLKGKVRGLSSLHGSMKTLLGVKPQDYFLGKTAPLAGLPSEHPPSFKRIIALPAERRVRAIASKPSPFHDARRCRRVWVLHLDPICAPARAVGPIAPLRDDPFKPQTAGVLENVCAGRPV